MSDGATQTILAGREDGVPGNCVQAAVATVLGLPIEAVPHFLLWEHWNHALSEWLMERGYGLRCRFTSEIPDERCIVAGRSPRGISHVCVAEGGEIIWDPHPDRTGLVAVDEAWTFIPLRPAASTPEETKP